MKSRFAIKVSPDGNVGIGEVFEKSERKYLWDAFLGDYKEQVWKWTLREALIVFWYYCRRRRQEDDTLW